MTQNADPVRGGLCADCYEKHDPYGHVDLDASRPEFDAFDKVLDELREMHHRKNQDYGRDEDPYANVRASIDFGMPAWVGGMVRGNDKMRRLQRFAQKGSLRNESVEDSLIDLAVYSIISLILFREESQ